ncbi:substrate-binding periplasmic protein [Marinobacter sp. JSM 1782161]|uniref:substrate-binding periplasmic protein n=1 Tax=Marinobacter sp. JSM 1782161 TaxID=2685906 RepID=UPI001D17E897|nr:transporter substrate-binding domain-containing protein [Marinobacter sp. JSM 1782161]
MSGLFQTCARILAIVAGMMLVATTVDAEDSGMPADRIVRIATGDWQPYVDSAKPDFGPLGHVIRTAFARAGYEVRYRVFPWTRNAQFVATGEQDAMMPYYCSTERARKYRCSLPIVSGEQVFFHRDGDSLDWDSMADLADQTIGATLGYFYGGSFERAEQRGTIAVKRIADDAANLRLLLRGRIDLYPQDRAVGYGMIRANLPESQWHGITHDPRPLHRESLHLLFGRQGERGKQLMTVFDRELRAMRDSGELERLLNPIYADQRAVRGAPASDAEPSGVMQ